MKKILLISDTHGNLDLINALVEENEIDFVIHAGDFGFYDNQSLYRLSQRELRLLVTHSLHRKEYDIDTQTEPSQLREIVSKHNLLGTFQAYLDSDKTFAAPIYVVWGNHDDAQLIKQLLRDNPVKNLKMLHAESVYSFQDKDSDSDEFKLFGIGGNFLVSKKLLRMPIAGQAGKVFSTLHEYGTLYQQLQKKSKPSIFVSHVSPGKEPLLTRMMIHFMPDLWISGHMGAPFGCVWNQFTIRDFNESLAWFDSQLDDFKKLIEGASLTPEAQFAAELIIRPIPRKDFWFKKLWNINLPDIKDGHAVLTIDNGRYSLQTYSRGMIFSV